LILLGLLAAASVPAAGEELDRIVLRVNDQIVTLRQYEERRDARLQAISAASDLSITDRRQAATDAGKATMHEIFQELLILSRAQQLHIEATPAKIDRAVDQTRRRYGIESDEEFERAIVESGGTMAQFRDRMARNILYSEVMQHEVSPKVKVDDEEVPRYWRAHPDEFAVPEQRHVEEAVIRDDSGLGVEERERRAAAIRDALVGGQSLADAVGGDENVLTLDHEWIEKGALDATLEAAVWELPAGGVGGPVPARGGLHVLRVVEIRPATQKPLEAVREEILNKLRDQQFESESVKFVDDLAAHAYIVEKLPPDAEGYRDATTGDRDPLRALLRGKEHGAPGADGAVDPATSTPESETTTAPPDPSPAQIRRK